MRTPWRIAGLADRTAEIVVGLYFGKRNYEPPEPPPIITGGKNEGEMQVVVVVVPNHGYVASIAANAGSAFDTSFFRLCLRYYTRGLRDELQLAF